ncbi:MULTISPECIES: arsenite efflux transporter metallochaperone ArsD [unclassified Exiguobacterium]|uniref:arsenite efflux transporter metallochaperone ArsD n=1 Tax=unclassified Exiguobacterium TaxID=2644629 RepID=UPI001BEC196A|nr:MULTISPECIES: arsenite efflux transporter metallochaperone ArsD [unclassified Exiguobacterium]
MKKIEIYDPAMCCPTGLCGPSIDPELTRMATVVHVLKQHGYPIERFNLVNEPDAFVENQLIKQAITDGVDTLPITLVNGSIVRRRGYLSNAELAELTGVEEKSFAVVDGQKPKIRLTLK